MFTSQVYDSRCLLVAHIHSVVTVVSLPRTRLWKITACHFAVSREGIHNLEFYADEKSIYCSALVALLLPSLLNLSDSLSVLISLVEEGASLLTSAETKSVKCQHASTPKGVKCRGSRRCDKSRVMG